MIWLIAIVALGLLIIVHEGGHYLVARWSGMRVERFSIGFGPALLKFQRGETLFQIGAIPLGGFVQISGLGPTEEQDGDGLHPDDPRLYNNRPVWQRLATIFAGPGINYVFAVVVLLGLFIGIGVPRPGKLPMIVQVMEGAPAQIAGLQLGDEVITVDGKTVKNTTEVSPIVDASQGRALEIVVLRGDEQKTFQVTPRNDGDKFRIGIGIDGRAEFVAVPAREAIVEAFVYPYYLSRENLKAIGQMIVGKRARDLSGPVGIVSQLKQQFSRGIANGLMMVASISALLGLFNLLPFPGLDGGRLVFLVYEAAARRPFPQRLEQSIHTVGILTLFALVIWVTFSKDLPLGSLLKR